MSSARDLGRLHQIAKVLIYYGFGDAVRRLGIGSLLEKSQRILPTERAQHFVALTPPERMRHVLQELGPTFIKLGQILATRRDLFEPEWIAEFEKLQDQVPPQPFEEIEAEITLAFEGQKWSEVFQSIDPEPLAAASIAQVHSAVLCSGEEVVLKVRRPGIRRVVEADLRLIRHLVKLANFEFPELRRYQLEKVVRQFSLSLQREMNLALEGRHCERIAAILQTMPEVEVPKIYWQWTSERMNVQSRLRGIPGRQIEQAKAQGVDLKKVARIGARAVLKMILEAGFFQADPHPGNFLFLENDRIGMVDFGMVGQLTEARKDQVIDLLLAVVTQDSALFTQTLLDWSSPPKLDVEALTAEVDLFLSQYSGRSLKQLQFTELVLDFMALLRDHELVLPADLALLSKAFITLDGLGRALDPDFVMVDEIAPFVRRLTMARYLPQNLMKRSAKGAQQLFSLLYKLPQDLQQLLRGVRKGYLGIHIEINQLDRFERRLNAIANRLSVATVVAALIIGSSIVMTVDKGPTILDLPLFGFLGFVSALIGGVWLLLSIWLSSKR